MDSAGRMEMVMKRWAIIWMRDKQGLVKARRFSDLRTWVRRPNETEAEFSERVAAKAAADVDKSHETRGPDTAA
jgi:hypothetical protein